MDEVWIDKWIAVFITQQVGLVWNLILCNRSLGRLDLGIVWYVRIPDQSG